VIAARPHSLRQNNSPLGRAAHKWLMQAREHAPPRDLHLLSLAWWGLENRVEGEWPERDRAALEQQVSGLFAWEPKNVLKWLLSNPNGPESGEQLHNLLQSLKWAQDPRRAAAVVLSEIYSRQQADNPALQPAASGS
jgi:hypothetical protein